MVSKTRTVKELGKGLVLCFFYYYYFFHFFGQFFIVLTSLFIYLLVILIFTGSVLGLSQLVESAGPV